MPRENAWTPLTTKRPGRMRAPWSGTVQGECVRRICGAAVKHQETADQANPIMRAPVTLPSDAHERATEAARCLGAYLEIAAIVGTVCQTLMWLSSGGRLYPFRDWEYQRKAHIAVLEMPERVPIHWNAWVGEGSDPGEKIDEEP